MSYYGGICVAPAGYACVHGRASKASDPPSLQAPLLRGAQGRTPQTVSDHNASLNPLQRADTQIPTAAASFWLGCLPERVPNKERSELRRGPSQGQCNLRCLHVDPLPPPSPPSTSRIGPGLLPRRVALQSFDLLGPALALLRVICDALFNQAVARLVLTTRGALIPTYVVLI